jgi:hypothetical protein
MFYSQDCHTPRRVTRTRSEGKKLLKRIRETEIELAQGGRSRYKEVVH